MSLELKFKEEDVVRGVSGFIKNRDALKRGNDYFSSCLVHDSRSPLVTVCNSLALLLSKGACVFAQKR